MSSLIERVVYKQPFPRLRPFYFLPPRPPPTATSPCILINEQSCPTTPICSLRLQPRAPTALLPGRRSGPSLSFFGCQSKSVLLATDLALYILLDCCWELISRVQSRRGGYIYIMYQVYIYFCKYIIYTYLVHISKNKIDGFISKNRI